MFKENVISLYNELSKLQCINKLETEKDYFIIGDLNSIKVLSESVVQHISSGYSFLKTGYDMVVIARQTAKGQNYHTIESAFLHLIDLHHLKKS